MAAIVLIPLSLSPPADHGRAAGLRGRPVSGAKAPDPRPGGEEPPPGGPEGGLHHQSETPLGWCLSG